jgi:predicted phosphodiesterase
MSFPTYEEVLALKSDETIKNIWVYLSEKYGEDKERLRRWFRTETDKKNREADSVLLEEVPQEEEKYKAEESVSYDDEGGVKYVSSSKIIMMTENDKKNPEFVLKAHGFDPKQWILVSAISNYWQGMRKDDLGAATLYQSKINVKPKDESFKKFGFDDVRTFFSELNIPELKLVGRVSRTVIDSKQRLIVNLADAHFGNGVEVKESVLKLAEEIVYRSRMKEFSEIVFVNLGDLLHTDNYAGQTTSGTQVGKRGENPSQWKEATETMILVIEKLAEISPVKYITICGNHDRISSYTIGQALEYYFKSDLNVEFDTSFEDRKYYTFGNSLFGFCHGDLPSKNIPSVIQREAREQYGKTKYAYMLLGHLHHTRIEDKDGVIVSNLPSLAETDEWHRQNAYTGAWKGTLCYVVDDEKGIVDTWHIEA